MWATPPVRLGLSGRNPGKIPERPRKRSQSVSWNSPREYGWDAPNPIIQGIWGFQRISRILSPPVRLGTPLFSEVVPERASQSRSWNSQQYWGYLWLWLGKHNSGGHLLLDFGRCWSRQPLLETSDLGAENCTQTYFSQTFRVLPGYIPAKSQNIPPKKFDSLGFEGHTELFGPHPFTWKTPTPPENIRTQKFRFGFFFSMERKKGSLRKGSFHSSNL